MERHPRIGQVQGDALSALTALLSPVRGFTSHHLLDRGLGLALDAAANRPANGAVAEHALALLLGALTTQDDAARVGIVKHLHDARRLKHGRTSVFCEGVFVSTLAKVIERLPPTKQWRQQDTVILKRHRHPEERVPFDVLALHRSPAAPLPSPNCGPARHGTFVDVVRSGVSIYSVPRQHCQFGNFCNGGIALIIAEKKHSGEYCELHFDCRRAVLRAAAYLRCGKAGPQSSVATLRWSSPGARTPRARAARPHRGSRRGPRRGRRGRLVTRPRRGGRWTRYARTLAALWGG
jgi:hypothetical protein